MAAFVTTIRAISSEYVHELDYIRQGRRPPVDRCVPDIKPIPSEYTGWKMAHLQAQAQDSAMPVIPVRMGRKRSID